MQEFHVAKNGFKSIQKKVIVRLVIMFTVIFVLVILLPALMSDDQGRLNTFPIMTVLFAGIVIFSVLNGLKKQRVLYESIVLRIDDDTISRDRANTPTLSIH